ncbi:MAG: phage tail protein [Cetobacterium sp.]|uniref:phage tail protein n=1 Tax=Cetobacterium sp. TaxID=2071632 RepID=UPI003EE5FBDE
MTDTTLDINRDALKINVSQYGWTSVEVSRVDLLADYLAQAYKLLQEIKDFQGEYDSFFDIFDQVNAMYNELTAKLGDFNNKYPVIVNLHSEVVRLHAEVLRNANNVNLLSIRVSSDASDVSLAKQAVQENQDKVAEDAAQVAKTYADILDIAEELKKGNVYRGTWNPHSGAYPTNHQGANSTWDVVLNAGETEYDWNGIKWYWGDRLIYLAADGSYTQIETGSSVLSVNGLTGTVRLDMADIYRNAAGDEKLSIEAGNGAVVVADGKTITDLTTKIDNIVGGAIISENPPLNPKEGVTWFCTKDARTYIWFKDEDGTVQWVDQNPDRIIIENIGGVPLLSVQWFPSRAMIAPGYIPADGQLVSKNLYSEAWDKVRTGVVPTVPDPDWIADPFNRGAYTTGTADQFRIPDYNGKSPGSAGAPFKRGDGTGVNFGRLTESQNKAHTHTRGDMNITGSFGDGDGAAGGNFFHNVSHASPKGCFTSTETVGGYRGAIEAVVRSANIGFDASKNWTGKTSSNGGTEAHPLTVTGVWALKVYDQLLDPATLDVNEAMTELGKVKAELASYQGAGVPVGTVQWFSVNEVPFGYLLCDGRQVSRAAYPDLYKVIGDTYGPGDGTSSFNLPDLENEFIRGCNPATREVGSKQGDAIRNITGTLRLHGGETPSLIGHVEGPFYKRDVHNEYRSLSDLPAPRPGADSSGGFHFDVSRVVPTSDENRPRNVAMLPVIKAYSHVVDSGALDTADIELRVQNLEGRWENSLEICLVNTKGSGHPHEFVSADIPATIQNNSRYVVQNPFGKNTPVMVVAEIHVNGAWCDSGFIFSAFENGNGYGAKATYKQEEGIIIQTGNSSLVATGMHSGSGLGVITGAIYSAPCRIRVIKTV